ncbi:SpoIIE family protein phosphatase [Acetobacteraceae bacterium H6797]|nr:SpoIIE family protein phosphatase [Acetobacteraceae bacterium H6797]
MAGDRGGAVPLRMMREHVPTQVPEESGPGPAGGRVVTASSRALGGLARTIFLRTFPVIAFVVLVTQLGIAWLNHGDQLRDQTERAQLMADLTARAIALPVSEGRPAVYRPQIEGLKSDPSFRGVELRDASGQVLLEIGQVARQTGNRSVTVSTEPRLPDGAVVGRLTLSLSTDEARASASFQAMIALGAMVILIMVVAVALRRVVARDVVAPLQKLLVAMHAVERKQWTHVELRRSDEIGEVGETFNHMVDGLRSGDEAKQLLAELETAHARLEQANKLVMESITYARRIQASMLPDEQAMLGSLADIASLWQPLHTVGGDYFWVEQRGDLGILVVLDCTGHGVPGAFMTLVVAAALDRALNEQGLRSPAELLRAIDRMVRARLRQDGRGAESDDGLDGAICVWNRAERKLLYAGAGMPLLMTEGEHMQTLRGARHGLGYSSVAPSPEAFVDTEIAVKPGQRFYLFTDGVSDQMGGTPRRLLGRKRLSDMLLASADMPLAEQMAALEAGLAAYRGEEPRRDDMTMLAFMPLPPEASPLPPGTTQH